MGISIYSLKHFWKKPIFIDLILLGAFIISVTLSIKFSGKLYNFDYSSFFLNLSASLLCIWITVHCIDFLTTKREKLRFARSILLENLKHPFVHIDIDFYSLKERDLEYLKRENKWFENKWGNGFFRTVLKDKEWLIAEKLINLNKQILMDVDNVIISKKIIATYNPNTINEDEKILRERLDKLKEKMLEIEYEIEKLQTEMWKTDKPIPL